MFRARWLILFSLKPIARQISSAGYTASNQLFHIWQVTRHISHFSLTLEAEKFRIQANEVAETRSVVSPCLRTAFEFRPHHSSNIQQIKGV